MGKRVICLLCCLAVWGAAGVALGEMVGHWKFDEGAGTKAADSSGKGNNGTLVNDPTWTQGVEGGALEFHGLGLASGTAGHVNVPHSASLDITGRISIALWIRPGAADPEGKATRTAPLAKALSTASPSWSYQVRYGWGSSQPFMAFTFNTTPRAWAYVGRKLVQDEWCHIACSYDGTTLRAYLNGLEAGSTPMGPITSSPAPTLIGTDGWGCDWIGRIDDVRIYNHALTADAIADFCPSSRQARSPSPANGAVGVMTPLFRWEAGYKAVMHEVYIGTSPDLGPANLAGPRSPVLMHWYLGVLQPGVTYYWRVDEIAADMVTVHKGNVWSFTMQALTAYLPSPKDGASDASVTAKLSWQPGQMATKHHVYFGKSRDAVTQGTGGTDKGIQAETTFSPGTLDSVTTYYWRVDEIKADNSVVTGSVWSFTTSLPVDDFESYTDKDGNCVFDIWVDGFSNGLSGSTVGLLTAVNGTYGETTIFHGGKQSMPMDYNNVKAPFYSEAERTFTPTEDFTKGDVDTLVLYVYGRGANGPALLYVGLTDSANKTAFVQSANTSPVTTARWTEWKIPLTEFAGVNLARVKKMTIGVGQRTGATAGGAGRIYVDDIRLIRDQK